MSRPTSYTEKIGDEICDRLSKGESLKKITLSVHIPSERSVFRWLESHESFRQQYAHAREAQVEHYADEIVDIADGVNGETEGAVVQAARLAIDARKWIAAKRLPKKYGDKLDVTANVTLEQLVMASLKPPASEDE